MKQQLSLFWNEKQETMSAEELQNLQIKRFRRMVSYAYEHSRAYRKLYDDCGIHPEEIRSAADIARLPIVDKSFFYDSDHSLAYGDSLAVPPADIAFFHQTSGTTATPLPQPDTQFDWQMHAECWAQMLWAQGVRPGDKALIAFNYNLFIGFWQAHYGCEKIGAELITTGGLSTEIRLKKIQELGVTVLVTTPTYAFRMAEYAEKAGIDLRKTTVKTIILSGEAGALIDGVKEKIRHQWDADVFDSIGATEVGAWGFECSSHPGGLHILEPFFYAELVDMDSGEPITEPGRYGKLILTNLYRRGRPCIRFDTKDIACWSENRCECGRTFRMLRGGVQGRADHLLKVRGTFFNPATVENIIAKDENCSHEYRIYLGKDNYSVSLVAEAAKNVPESRFPEMEKELQRKISTAIFMRLNVEVLPFGSLERGDAKTKRIIDLREKRA